MSDIRIYVACLASYNAGVLHGAWIDATQDADAIQSEVDAMLRASRFPNVQVACPKDCGGPAPVHLLGDPGFSPCETCKATGRVPSAEEWSIHDYEGFERIKLGESESFENVAALAAAIEEHGEAFAIWWGNETRDDVDANAFREQYAGEYKDLEDFAYNFLEDTGGLSEVPEHLRNYFDYEAYARDMRLNGDVWEERGHVFWNH